VGEPLDKLKQADLEKNNITICSILGNKNTGYSQFGLPNSSTSALILVRPDGYVLGRWQGTDIAPLLAAMQQTGVSV
jgi:hypothetical protein